MSASAKCAAGLNRSAGFLASARVSTSAIAGGTAGRSCEIGRASAVRCWWTTFAAVGPVKGGWPASISYSTQPSA